MPSKFFQLFLGSFGERGWLCHFFLGRRRTRPTVRAVLGRQRRWGLLFPQKLLVHGRALPNCDGLLLECVKCFQVVVNVFVFRAFDRSVGRVNSVPEVLDKTIRELPREVEVVELFNKLAGADPLPPR